MQQNLWDESAILEEFKIWLREHGKSDGTIYSYSLNVKQYMKWHTGTFGAGMAALRHVNVLDYRSYLQNVKKDAAGTVNTKLAALISPGEFLIETDRQKETAVSRKDLLRVQAGLTLTRATFPKRKWTLSGRRCWKAPACGITRWSRSWLTPGPV